MSLDFLMEKKGLTFGHQGDNALNKDPEITQTLNLPAAIFNYRIVSSHDFSCVWIVTFSFSPEYYKENIVTVPLSYNQILDWEIHIVVN